MLWAQVLLFSQESPQPILTKALYFDVSPPLRDMVLRQSEKADLSWKEGFVRNFYLSPEKQQIIQNRKPDNMIQDYQGKVISDTTRVNFEGVNNVNNVVPPDTYGDIGPSHYFQLVNLSFAIFDRQGQKLLGPVNTSTIWDGMPHNFNNGDGVVLYDENADRWLVSQFSFPSFPEAPFYQMVAVSQTSDPTGSWYRWEFKFDEIPDYPKFGVWRDGYYMSYTRIKSNSFQWLGVGA
ncbi:MAG: hypothetical protein WCO93_07090, partial [bacterium]